MYIYIHKLYFFSDCGIQQRSKFVSLLLMNTMRNHVFEMLYLDILGPFHRTLPVDHGDLFLIHLDLWELLSMSSYVFIGHMVNIKWTRVGIP